MKPLVPAVTLAVAAVLLTACTRSAAPASPVASALPTAGTAPVAPVTTGEAAGQAFFAPLRPGPAVDPKAPPASLKAAYAEATAVIEADVAGVRAGREIGELSSVIVTLRPARVLRGTLRPEIPVEVEFGPIFDPPELAGIVAAMGSAPSPGRGIWLLRWQGDPPPVRKPGTPKIDTAADVRLYHTVHPQCGVFVQGADHVDAATARDDGESVGVRVEGERFATLAELADHAVMA